MSNLLIFLFFILGSTIGSYVHATAYRYTKESLDKFYEKHENRNSNYFLVLIEEFKKYINTFYPVRSHCPVCNYQLKWYHNIPVFSYIFLGGKCANCKTNIPIIYLLAETFLGIVFATIFYKFYFIEHKELFYIISFLFFISILYLIALIDLKSYYIPDIFLIFLIPFALILYYYDNTLKYFLYSFIFTIISYYLILYIYVKFNKIYIGFGDIKIFMFLFPFMHTIKELDIFIILFGIVSLFNYFILYLLSKFDKKIPAALNIFIAFYLYILLKEKLLIIFF